MQVLNNKNTYSGGQSHIKVDIFRCLIQVRFYGTDVANFKAVSTGKRARHCLILNSDYIMDF